VRLGDSLELYAHLTYTTFGMYIICALCTHMYIMYTHVQHVLYIYMCVRVYSQSCTCRVQSYVNHVFFMYIVYCSRTCLRFRGVYYLVTLFLQFTLNTSDVF
jgi:hypothetical protein